MAEPLRKIFVWSDSMAAQFRSRFVFKLLTGFDITIDLEWHYMEAHHGKGVGGTVKNKVFKQVKSGRLTVNSPKEFAAAAQDLVPSITTLFLPIAEMLEEPHDIDNSPKIPETLDIHKVKRSFNLQGIPLMEFSKMSNEDACFTQYYGDVCGHKKADIDESTCGYCLEKWNENEKGEWLQCPMSKNWFHQTSFHI